MQENTDQNNSEYGHLLRSVSIITFHGKSYKIKLKIVYFVWKILFFVIGGLKWEFHVK